MSSNDEITKMMAQSIYGRQDYDGSDDDAEKKAKRDRRDLYQGIEYSKVRTELDQAFARGVVSADDYERMTASAQESDRSNWLQHALGINNSKNDGGVLETIFDVLSLGTYMSASVAKATLETGYDVGPFKIGFSPSAVIDNYRNKTTYTSLFSDKGVDFSPEAAFKTSAHLYGMDRYSRHIGDTTERSVFWSGFAADVALDPMTWITMGVGPGTKAAVTTSKAAALKILPESVAAASKLGHTELTLSKFGSEIWRLAAVEVQGKLARRTAQINASRALKGERALHLLDERLVTKEVATEIGDYMIQNFDKLKALHAQRVLAGGESKFARAMSYLPGTDAFAERATTAAQAMASSITGDIGKRILNRSVGDLFDETARAGFKDRGLLNAYGFAANKKPALQKMLANAKGIGGVMKWTFDTFDYGWSAPPDVVEKQRHLSMLARHEEEIAAARYSEVFHDMTPDERQMVTRLVESRETEFATGAKTTVKVPRIDHSDKIWDDTMKSWVDNPNFGKPHMVTDELGNKVPDLVERVVYEPALAKEGTLGSRSKNSDKVEAAVKFVQDEMSAILADEKNAGLDIGEIENYITHIYKDPGARDAVIELVARRNAVDSLKSSNRFAQARAIASIDAVEAMYGKGALELDALEILNYRKRASVNVMSQERFFKYIAQNHGVAESVVQALEMGTKKGFMRTLARNMGEGYHFVVGTDQVYTQKEGRLVKYGLRNGDKDHNIKLMEYLSQPLDSNGRMSDEWMKWAQANGISDDARFAPQVSGSFSYKEEVPRFVVGEGRRMEKVDRTFKVSDVFEMASDTKHPLWGVVLGEPPDLRNAYRWFRGLDAHLKSNFDSQGEGVLLGIRNTIIDAYEARQAMTRADTEAALKAAREHEQEVLGEFKNLELMMELAREYAPGDRSVMAQLRLDKRAIRARSSMIDDTVRRLLAREGKYRSFHQEMDKLSGNMEVRGMEPGLPDAFVDYLRQRRREMGIIVDDVSPTTSQVKEAQELAARLGMSAEQVRRTCKALFDSPSIKTAAQADRFILALRPSTIKEVRSGTVALDLQFTRPLKEEDALYRELYRDRAATPMDPSAPGKKSEAGRVLASERGAAVGRGEVPEQQMRQLDTGANPSEVRNDLYTDAQAATIPDAERMASMPRKGASKGLDVLIQKRDEILRQVEQVLPEATAKARQRVSELEKYLTPHNLAQEMVKTARGEIKRRADEIGALRRRLKESQVRARALRDEYLVLRSAKIAERGNDPAYAELRSVQSEMKAQKAEAKKIASEEAEAAKIEDPIKRAAAMDIVKAKKEALNSKGKIGTKQVFEAMKKGAAESEHGGTYKIVKKEVLKARDAARAARKEVDDNRAAIERFFKETGIDKAVNFREAVRGVQKVAGDGTPIENSIRNLTATKGYVGDLSRAAKKAEKELNSLLGKIDKKSSALPTEKLTDLGRPVSEAATGGARVRPVAASSTVRVYVPDGLARFAQETLQGTVDYKWSENVQRMFRMYDAVSATFKSDLLMPFTGTWLRDLKSNVALNYLASGLTMFHPDTQAAFWKTFGLAIGRHTEIPSLLRVSPEKLDATMKAWEATKFVSRDGRETSLGELLYEARMRGVLHGGPSGEILTEGAATKNVTRGVGAVRGAIVGGVLGTVAGGLSASALEELSNYKEPDGGWSDPRNAGALLGAIAGIALGARKPGALRAGNRAVEFMTNNLQTGWKPLLRPREYATDVPARLGVFISEFYNTGSYAEAGRKVYQHLNDWQSFSVVERRFLKRAFPFYSWTKLAITQSGRSMFENSERLGTIVKAVNGWNTANHVDPQDVPDFLENQIALLSERMDNGDYRMKYGFGLPIEDAARLMSAFGPSLDPTRRDAKEIGMEVLRRGPFGITSFAELFLGIDSRTGRPLFPDPSSEVYKTDIMKGEPWAGAPTWLKGLVGYQAATPDSDAMVLNPKVAWVLGEIPPSRFISVAKQVYEAEDPGAFNMDTLARSLLGSSAYVVNPQDQRYYLNRGRIDAMKNLLSNIGWLRSYQGVTDANPDDGKKRRRRITF